MVRWIVKNKLGTAAAESVAHDDAFLIDVRELVDKGGNDPEAVRATVVEGTQALRGGRTVLVVCDFGVSRSNSIATGILAQWKGISFDDAVIEVSKAIGEDSIKLNMLNAVREALGKEEIDVQQPGATLLTGASGFIGSELLRRMPDAFIAPSRSEFDLCTSATIIEVWCRKHNVTKVVHLAHPRVYTNNSAMGEAVTMLRNIMDVCRSLDAHLYFLSSDAVFSGHRDVTTKFLPSAELRPKGPFGETKFLEEQLIRNALACGELTASIMRVPAVYGPNCFRPRLLHVFTQSILSNQPIRVHRYTNGYPALDLLHVSDLVDGIGKVLAQSKSSTYHFGSDSLHTPTEIARMIASFLKREVAITEMQLTDSVGNIHLDTTTTRKRLSWIPRVSLPEGVREFLASYAY